jgi:hypothetical protein
VRTAENAREIFELHQHRILVPDGHDAYRLSRNLMRFLDDLTQKQRLYESLGADIGKLNDRIHLLRREYNSAIVEGKNEDIDVVAGDFYDACAELSDAVSSSLERLLIQAESNFGAVRSLSAKERQNRYYLDEADKLSSALGSLERMNLQEELDLDPLTEGTLAIPYRRLVTHRLAEWSTELLRVTGILKDYLFKLRQIAPDVRRLRDFVRFIHQNPGYVPPEIDGLRNLPSWAMRDHGMALLAHPDPGNRDTVDALEEIARKLPAPKVEVKVPKSAGTLVNGKSGGKIAVPIPAHRLALQRFGHAALQSQAPISSIEWKRKHAADLDIPDDLWIHLVINSENIARAPFTRLHFEPVSRRGLSPISRNVVISDVRVHGRT